VLHDGANPYQVVWTLELRGDLVQHETIHLAEPFPAPDWRRPWPGRRRTRGVAMAADQPGPPGDGNRHDRPTQPLGGSTPPPEPLPSSSQAGGDLQSPGPTAPVPGSQYHAARAPTLPADGPPREALAGFWRRAVSAFLDWLLVGFAAAAVGALFGVDPPAPPPAQGDGFNFQLQLAGTGPYLLVELAYFTYFHATSAGQSIGNKILGIRVLDADTGASLPYVRAFVRALMSNISALPCFLGFFWMLWEPRKRTWHDMVANSLVVRADVYPPAEFGRPAR
jgi:uncharacterized RDD family membrane protein YckC